MVSTRSARKERDSRQDSDEPVAAAGTPAAESSPSPVFRRSTRLTPQPSSASTPVVRSTKKSGKKVREQALRLKSTGVGLSISIDSDAAANRKIVFSEEDQDEGKNDVDNSLMKHDGEEIRLAGETEPERENLENVAGIGNDDDDDDDDDSVEEIQQSTARQHMEAEQSKERASVAAIGRKQTKRRKRKERTKDDDAKEEHDDDEELASDFFSELDAELAEDRKKRKHPEQPIETNPMGKHTTFVVDGDEKIKVRVNDTIELVVLDQIKEEADSFVSKQALIYSRSQLLDGKVALSAKKRHQAKKAGRKDLEPEGWVRSRKMNRLLAPGRANLRKHGKGVVAPRFVVKENT